MIAQLQHQCRRLVTPLGRRSLSSAKGKSEIVSPVPEIYRYDFKKTWLEDPSAYPLIVIMGVAGCFLVGMSANALMYYKDVRLRPKFRQHQPIIRDYGEERVHTVVDAVVESGFASKPTPTGLGVDYEAWLKAKSAIPDE